MADQDEIDYLNDPLLVDYDEKAKISNSSVLDRAAEVLQRIEEFVRNNGHEPQPEPGRDTLERMLANDLAGLRASREELSSLMSLDTTGLVFTEPVSNPLDDPILADNLDIFRVSDDLRPLAKPDYVAGRKECADFDRFAPMFEKVRQKVRQGILKPQRFRQERVDLGEFFVLKGQLVHVADVREQHARGARTDARLRVIFDNATEADLLMSSLVRRLYEDKDAARVGTADAGPLFEGAKTGVVYVLRSLSDRPEVQGLLKVGTTSGSVEDRISGAEKQSTYLYAGVEILATYEFVGHSAKEAEKRVHRALARFNVQLKVTGPDGRLFKATEWFQVTPETVDAAVRSALA